MLTRCGGGYRYKGRGAYDAILPYLDKCHEEQVKMGVVGEEEKKANYPY